jgi:hypothetical protein
MRPGSSEVLLIAIAKARKSIDNLARGQSFAEIARREGKAERHIRHLAPLTSHPFRAAQKSRHRGPRL